MRETLLSEVHAGQVLAGRRLAAGHVALVAADLAHEKSSPTTKNPHEIGLFARDPAESAEKRDVTKINRVLSH